MLPALRAVLRPCIHASISHPVFFPVAQWKAAWCFVRCGFILTHPFYVVPVHLTSRAGELSQDQEDLLQGMQEARSAYDPVAEEGW